MSAAVAQHRAWWRKHYSVHPTLHGCRPLLLSVLPRCHRTELRHAAAMLLLCWAIGPLCVCCCGYRDKDLPRWLTTPQHNSPTQLLLVCVSWPLQELHMLEVLAAPGAAAAARLHGCCSCRDGLLHASCSCRDGLLLLLRLLTSGSCSSSYAASCCQEMHRPAPPSSFKSCLCSPRPKARRNPSVCTRRSDHSSRWRPQSSRSDRWGHPAAGRCISSSSDVGTCCSSAPHERPKYSIIQQNDMNKSMMKPMLTFRPWVRDLSPFWWVASQEAVFTSLPRASLAAWPPLPPPELRKRPIRAL